MSSLTTGRPEIFFSTKSLTGLALVLYCPAQRSLATSMAVGRLSVRRVVRTTWAGRGGETMLKIEDFHALLTSDSEENALLAALRKLTEVRKVEEIIDPIGPNSPNWW